jgi:septal ring factor EnvC (AmiA/AmiB activator)
MPSEWIAFITAIVVIVLTKSLEYLYHKLIKQKEASDTSDILFMQEQTKFRKDLKEETTFLKEEIHVSRQENFDLRNQMIELRTNISKCESDNRDLVLENKKLKEDIINLRAEINILNKRGRER